MADAVILLVEDNPDDVETIPRTMPCSSSASCAGAALRQKAYKAQKAGAGEQRWHEHERF